METEAERAVKIAARIFAAGGFCRYDDTGKCRRIYVDEATCAGCIRRFLISKAKKDLAKE